MASEQPTLSIIIPAYNEEKAVGVVLRDLVEMLAATDMAYEIIVVDDGSTDQTAPVAESSGARVVRHSRNRGYGAALKSGIRAARYERIVICDADGTYPINRVPEMMAKLESADMIVGARVGQNVNIPIMRRPGKWLLRRLAEYITGQPIDDLNSGLRAFRRSLVIQYLSILPEKFSFTTTITVALLCDNYDVLYIPIDYHKRAGKSKIASWDFVSFITLVLRLSMFFNPLKVFVPVAFMCFGMGGLKFAMDVIWAVVHSGKISLSLLHVPVVSTSALLLLLTGVQVLLIGMMADGMARRFKQQQMVPNGFRADH